MHSSYQGPTQTRAPHTKEEIGRVNAQGSLKVYNHVPDRACSALWPSIENQITFAQVVLAHLNNSPIAGGAYAWIRNLSPLPSGHAIVQRILPMHLRAVGASGRKDD